MDEIREDKKIPKVTELEPGKGPASHTKFFPPFGLLRILKGILIHSPGLSRFRCGEPFTYVSLALSILLI
jgi:hypothetical protein